MEHKHTIKPILILLGIIAVYFLYTASRPEQTIINTVTNFEECAAAGNPVMESYPRQCIHEGIGYTEVIER